MSPLTKEVFLQFDAIWTKHIACVDVDMGLNVIRGRARLKKQNSFLGYILIGIGAFFLLKQLKIPIFTDFYSWPTLLIIIGLALIVYGYRSREYNSLFSGTIVLGLGVHFHGLTHYPFWIDHWAVYPLLVGIAFMVRALKLKKGMFVGLFLVAASLFMIYSIKLPEWFSWVDHIIEFFGSYWPIILIIMGVYLLMRKK